MGFYFWLGLLIGSVGLSVRALLTSVHERFALGIVAAMTRGLTVIPLALLLVTAYFPRLTGPLPWLVPIVLMAVAAMPAASFTAIVQAYRKTQRAPAADEERASRPFDAWLPVAIVDSIVVVVAVVTLLLSHPWG